MKRLTVAAVLVFLTISLTMPLLALEAGKAEGKAVVNGKTVKLTESYAWSGEGEGIVVMLTDKALPEGADPRSYTKALPAGTHAVLIFFDPEEHLKVARVVVHHPDGIFTVEAPSVGMEMQTDEDSIEGQLSVSAESTTPAGSKVRVRVAFNTEYTE